MMILVEKAMPKRRNGQSSCLKESTEAAQSFLFRDLKSKHSQSIEKAQ